MNRSFEYDPSKPGSYQQQFDQWRLCRDTWGMYDLTTHPGSAAEQAVASPAKPVVHTKRSMSKYRR